jgi:hypothetical protein
MDMDMDMVHDCCMLSLQLHCLYSLALDKYVK